MGSGLQRIITENEPWFFLYHPCDSDWGTSRDEFSQRVRHKINTQNCLVSILWSVNGVQSLCDVPKETRCDTRFFNHAVMPYLTEKIQSRIRRKRLKGSWIHMDDALPQIRGEVKSVWRLQELNACHIWLIVQTWPQATSSSFNT
jgi:hypothetical protein